MQCCNIFYFSWSICQHISAIYKVWMATQGSEQRGWISSSSWGIRWNSLFYCHASLSTCLGRRSLYDVQVPAPLQILFAKLSQWLLTTHELDTISECSTFLLSIWNTFLPAISILIRSGYCYHQSLPILYFSTRTFYLKSYSSFVSLSLILFLSGLEHVDGHLFPQRKTLNFYELQTVRSVLLFQHLPAPSSPLFAVI